jgi:hypothetical protein
MSDFEISKQRVLAQWRNFPAGECHTQRIPYRRRSASAGPGSDRERPTNTLSSTWRVSSGNRAEHLVSKSLADTLSQRLAEGLGTSARKRFGLYRIARSSAGPREVSRIQCSDSRRRTCSRAS